MMEQKRVSIVMCTYNGERFLHEQLDSLLAQTRLPDEIIIQDDNSTDGTWSLLENYAARDPRIRLYRNQAGQGVNNNFFSALQRATGDLIAISDQDDIWEPDKIECQLAAIGDNLLCTCRTKPFTTDGSPVSYDPRTPNYKLPRMLYTSIAGHTMLIDRRLLDMVPDHHVVGKLYYDVILAMTASAMDSISLVDKVLVHQRRYPEAETYTSTDLHRRPSVSNGRYTLLWSLKHYREMQPYLFDYFQRRHRLLQGIPARGETYEDVTAMADLEGRPGLGNLLRLCRYHVKHRHNLFYTEGRGLVNALRAMLYCIMHVYFFRHLLNK